ncbi:hypothetical protein [Hymenobacter negativus]|uniref:ATP-binding protein n=1 Tax=Hymenobacter negativus TaxID=2795026 RepID=A0ABS0QCK5_9BACT|nr:hypothetical protein [Hymenobacter negativus]MBH8560414.1 hypothetical protein [Hymenobacter negativus]
MYQLDITLLRWIALKDNQVLQLERGEDVDIVTNANNSSAQELSRELEQVKYRESKVSLNQEFALEMLHNFFQHLSNNSGQDLLFRYVTNAAYTLERPALALNGSSGIEVWKVIATDKNVASSDHRLLVIQQHLQRKIREHIQGMPATVQPAVKADWLAFDAYISDPDKLLDFVRRVDWSTRQTDYSAMSQQVEAALLTAQLVPDAANAKSLYARLFLYIAKQLSEAGLKQLNPAELRVQAQLPALSVSDLRLLQVIENLFSSLEARVSSLEENASQYATQLTQLLSKVEVLSQSDTVFDYRLGNLASTPPPPVQNGTLRAGKVRHLTQLLLATPWVHLQGINGSGKSQLAALVAREHSSVHWLELRAYNDSIEKTVLLLEAFLALITQRPVSTNRQRWLQEVVTELPAQTLLVLNDLPRIEAGSALEETLVFLANQLAAGGILLLTTSNFDVTPSTRRLLLAATFSEYHDVNFTDEEIAEYLTNCGAGPEVVALAGLVGVVTYYNPTLVGALVYHLQAMNWGADSADVLDVLIRQEFSAATLEDAQYAITRRLSDPGAKQLLYRLSLLNWGFGFTQVQAVSGVEAIIEAPREALQRILNLWIQSIGKVYYVSPLVHNLGEQNLSPAVVRGIHLAVAQSILENQTLDLLDTTRCFWALNKGQDYTKAGGLLLGILRTAENAEQAQLLRRCGLLTYATSTDIPAAMPRLLRAAIRYEQLRLHHLLGLDITAYQHWLTHYANETGGTLNEQVLVRLFKLINAEEWHFPEFSEDFLFVLANRAALTELSEDDFTPAQLAMLFWLPIRSINSVSALMQWRKLAEHFQAETGFDVWQEPIAQTAVTLISRQLAIAAVETSAEAALVILNEWADYYAQQQQELLRATVQAVSIPVQFQQVAERSNIIAEVAASAAGLALPDAQYLLFFALGKACYDANMKAESIEWLAKAVDLQCIQQDSFVEALIYAGAAISTHDTARALQFNQQAEELAAADTLIQEIDYLKVAAELALAYWLHHDIEQSFRWFEKVVQQLVEAKASASPEAWKRLYVWLRHALGYIARVAAREQAPERVADGGEYVAPYQGFFSFNTKDVSDLYDDNPAPHVLFYTMALFAEGIGDIDKAYEWSQRAFDAARQTPGEQALLMIAALCGQYALATGHYVEGLEAQLLAAAMSAFVKHEGLTQEQAMETFQLEELNSRRPGPVWNDAEATAVTLAVIPMVTLTLTAQLTNDARRTELTQACQLALDQYRSQASDQGLWSHVSEVSTEVLTATSSSRQLLTKASAFAQEGQRDLQVICLLGAIAQATDGRSQVHEMFKVLPYLDKTLKIRPAVFRFVLIPFVRQVSKTSIRECFVGTRTELDDLLESIENVAATEPHAVQLLLQPAVAAADLTVPSPRDTWLYQYREI